jgi:tetratricopeptide (TPR) repeat protein
MKRVMTKEEMLQEAVEAGQRGDLARARKLLLDLLRQDNREPLYWLLMSTAVESREERIYCLQNVLFLDPENSAARHDLELLGAEIPQENTPALLPEEQEDWQTAEIAAPKIPKKRKRPVEEPWPISLIFGSLGVGLVLILLGYYAAENGMLGDLFSTNTPTLAGRPGTLVAGPTRTPPAATATRSIVVVPRDPSELLEQTYTPTPRYIGTPHPGDGSFEDGLAALDAGEWDTAIAAFQDFLANNAQSADGAYYLGEAHLAAAQYPEALNAFEQAIALNPQFAPAYLGLARLGIAEGADAARILTDLNTALLLDQRLIEAYFTRIDYNLERGNLAAASDDAAAAVTQAPDSAAAHYYAAKVALAQENFAAALQASQLAYNIDLTFLPNYLILAEAQQGQVRYEESIETMQTYLNFSPQDGRGWELLGLGHQLSGNSELALEAFNRALELDHNLPVAAYYRGLAERISGNRPAALNFLRIAVAGEPNWFDARIALAEEYLNAGDPSAAFFEITSSGNLVSIDAERAAFFYWRALVLEALGQPQNALADWRNLLELPSGVVPPEWRTEAEGRVGG